MGAVILIAIIVVLIVKQANKSVAAAESDRIEKERDRKRKEWEDKYFDHFAVKDMERYILDPQNAEEVYALQEELAEVAPELNQHPLMFYTHQFGEGFTKDDRGEVIYYNLRFFVPFMLAKKGVVHTFDGLTFPHNYVLNKDASWEIKRTKQTPWGLSKKSIIELNKWMEKTFIERGIEDARIVFVPNIQCSNDSIFAGTFHWEPMCYYTHSMRHLW